MSRKPNPAAVPAMARAMAQWIRAVDPATLDAQVTAKARLCLIDMIGVAAQAHDLPWSRQAAAYATAMGGDRATLVGATARASVAEAAFANATMAHGLVQEDMHTASVSHIGVIVWPALLALAEHQHATGTELMTAGIIGYQVMARLGQALITKEVARRFRPTGLIGAIGAAAAGARLLRLSEDQTVHALALAANTAGGLNEWPHVGGGEMFFHAGFAARNAVTSVLLARAGATASESALDGRAGLFAAFGGEQRTSLDLSGAWEILAVYHKPAPACNYAQTPAQAALALHRDHGIASADIESVLVRSFPEAIEYPGCDHPGPYRSQLQAKMSIQFTVAAVLAHGRLDDTVFRDFSPTAPAARLALRVALRHDEKFAAAYPQHQGAEVAVSLNDGRTLHHRLAALEPLSPAGVRARTRGALERLFNGERAAQIEREIDDCAACDDAARIVRLLAGDPPNDAPTMPASRTIPDLIDEMARRFPEREALVGSGQRYTYRQLRVEVRRVARALHALGVRHGDKVAILMGNRPEWLIADFAITLLGGVMVGVNTWATARELEYVLAHSDTRVLITVDHFLKYDYFALLQALEPHRERLPSLEHIVGLTTAVPPGWLAFADLGRLAETVPETLIDAAQRHVTPTDVAYLLYTSGSTALPKGVPLQHYALIENMWHIGERQRVTERDRLWLAVSLYWGLGCENALFNLLTHGGCVVLQEHFDAGEALALIERERCTMFYGTPNMGQALHEHPDRPRRDLSSLRGGATIGTPEQIMRVVALGAREICNIYGLTETYGNCNVTDATDPLPHRLASIGRPLPGVDQRIVDTVTGAVLPAGQVGEIRVKGYVMPGYYKDPQRTAEAFDAHGYFMTGDLGFADADGSLHFRGRIKEMVKTGGINVAPVEVEEILMTHPDVHLAFVTGVPDPERDEVLAAVVVPKPGISLSADQLGAFCRETLSAYKVPRLIRFVTEHELPLTTTGKLQKNRLANLFFAEHFQSGQENTG